MIESPLVVCYVRYVHVISMQIFLFFSLQKALNHLYATTCQCIPLMEIK